MKNNFLLSLPFKNIGRNKRRTAFSIIAIATPVLLLIFMYGFVGGMFSNIESSAVDFYSGNVHIENSLYRKYEKYNPSHLMVPNSTAIVDSLKKESKLLVSPRIQMNVAALIKGSETDSERGVGFGIDLELENKYRGFSSSIVKGTAFSSDTALEALVSYGFAKKLNLNVGDNIDIMFQTSVRSLNSLTLKIVGFVSIGDLVLDYTSFYLPLKTAKTYMLAEDSDSVSEILIKKTNKKESLESFYDRVKKNLANIDTSSLAINTWQEVSAFYSMTQTIKIIYSFISIFYIVLGSTVIISSMLMIIYERKKEIAMMMTLGMSRKELISSFMFESLVISILGALIGLVAGILLVLLTSRTGIDLSHFAKFGNYPVKRIINPVISPLLTVIIPLVSMFISTLFCYLPISSLTKINILDNLRG